MSESLIADARSIVELSAAKIAVAADKTAEIGKLSCFFFF